MSLLGFACPVPPRDCKGTMLTSGNGRGNVRWHGDHKQVQRCESKYLMSKGYTRLSSRTFRPPEGGPPGILVLNKRPGMPIVTGKGGMEGGGTGRPMARARQFVAW